MNADDEKILKVTKEVLVKFIENGIPRIIDKGLW